MHVRCEEHKSREKISTEHSLYQQSDLTEDSVNVYVDNGQLNHFNLFYIRVVYHKKHAVIKQQSSSSQMNPHCGNFAPENSVICIKTTEQTVIKSEAWTESYWIHTRETNIQLTYITCTYVQIM